LPSPSHSYSIDRIKKAVEQLRLHPESGRPGRVDGTRELVIPRTAHIAAYRITDRTLEIIAFIHESQQWPNDL